MAQSAVRANNQYAQLLTTSHTTSKIAPITGTVFGHAGDGLLGGIDFNVAGLGLHAPIRACGGVNIAYLPAGGLCVVASAVACVNFFVDFVALRGCIGADVAFTVATIASCPSQPHSRAGSASTFAPRSRRGTAGDRPGSGNASTCAGDRRSSGPGARRSRHKASDHPGHRAEVCADTGKTSPGKTSRAGRGANGTQSATIILRDRRSQCGRRNACGAAVGEPDDDLGRGPQCTSDPA
jgi:hypothetical protein